MFEIDDPMTAEVDVLWREHADELLRFATVLVGPSDAPDIVIESFLRSAATMLSGEVDHPRAYLYRAVTNRAHDLRRSRERRWARDLAAIGPQTTTVHDTYIDVRRAVAGLSVQQRAVVYLAYWDDLSERAIADVLQIAPGSVRRHLVRARHHLRKALS